MSEKNGKKNSILPIIVVILLIIAILMIVLSLGFGGGLGSGNGNGDGNTSIVSENSSSDNTEENTQVSETTETSETVTEETTEAVTYLDITVSGNTYLLDGNETTIDDITETAGDDNIVVRITDDNAVADAMESLISALDEKNISYIEPTE